MKSLSPALKSLAVRTVVAAAAVAACSAASAFTFDPSAIAGVSSASFTADTLTVNDFAKVTFTDPTMTSFTEMGDLSVSAFNLGGTQVFPSGYGSSYGLYVSFTAAGSAGALTMLNYTVYGYSGPIATFGVTEAGGPSKTGAVGTVLATGSLAPGMNTFSGGVSGATLTANALTFVNTSGAFSSVGGATASFINSANQLTATSNGFLVGASLPGGGTINLIPSAVPEPETYALLLGGLAAVGFVARRRNNG